MELILYTGVTCMLYQLSGVFMWQVYSKEVKMCLLTNPDMISAAGS